MARCNDENSHPWAVRRRITHSSSAAPVCCAKLFCPCPAIRPDSFADCRGDRLREQLLWARRRPVQPERAAGERRHWGVDLGRRTTLQRHSPRFSRSRKVVAGHRLGRQDVPCPAVSGRGRQREMLHCSCGAESRLGFQGQIPARRRHDCGSPAWPVSRQRRHGARPRIDRRGQDRRLAECALARLHVHVKTARFIRSPSFHHGCLGGAGPGLGLPSRAGAPRGHRGGSAAAREVRRAQARHRIQVQNGSG